MLITVKDNKKIVVPAWVVTFYLYEEPSKEYFFFGGEYSSARDEAYSWLRWQPSNCWKAEVKFKDITYVMSE